MIYIVDTSDPMGANSGSYAWSCTLPVMGQLVTFRFFNRADLNEFVETIYDPAMELRIPKVADYKITDI